jgi:hypothetical protein
VFGDTIRFSQFLKTPYFGSDVPRESILSAKKNISGCCVLIGPTVLGVTRRRLAVVFINTASVFLLLTAPLLTATSAAQDPDTFVVKISLPTPTIHTGDLLSIEETVSNPTDHLVAVGSGVGVGSMVECLNAKGEDLGRRIMGPAPPEDTPVITGNKKLLRPGTSSKATWHYTLAVGALVPGTYRLRTYIRNMNSGAEVYSNVVALTVLP